MTPSSRPTPQQLFHLSIVPAYFYSPPIKVGVHTTETFIRSGQKRSMLKHKGQFRLSAMLAYSVTSCRQTRCQGSFLSQTDTARWQERP